MPKHARLKRKGNVWFFRAKVPQDVREVIGKTEVVRSLKTQDDKTACQRERVESLHFDQEVEQARRQKVAAPSVEDSPTRRRSGLPLCGSTRP